jgi:hypothetical protein
MNTPVSIHYIQEPEALEASAPSTLGSLPWHQVSVRLADPAWEPSYAELSLWALDPSEVLDAVTEHAGSDALGRGDLADLVARVIRRNTRDLHSLGQVLQAGGLESLTDAWHSVVEAWNTAASTQPDPTSGPTAAAIGTYFVTAGMCGLTHDQAVRFAACPYPALSAAMHDLSPVARARFALGSSPSASYTEVARSAGISPSYLRLIVSRYGDPARDVRRQTDRPQQVRSMVTDGFTYREVAQRLGCSIGYISKVMKAQS